MKFLSDKQFVGGTDLRALLIEICPENEKKNGDAIFNQVVRYHLVEGAM